jgi:hypothetical protein
MHKNTFWVLSPGVARQGFTAAIMAWVESPWDSSHLFLVPRIKQRRFGCVNKRVEFIGQFKGVPLGKGTLASCPFCSLLPPPFLCVFGNLTARMELTNLPKCERHIGFGTKLSICVGCEGCITPGYQSHLCLFRNTGYEFDGVPFSPCGNQYHPECIGVGKPFKTRLVRVTLGLQYPPAMTRIPFICESCTVRVVLRRELTWTLSDIQLLMLERMRLVDMAHAWASSTLQGTAITWDGLENSVRSMASTFFRRLRSPNLLSRRSFLYYGGYWSILSRRPGRWGG